MVNGVSDTMISPNLQVFCVNSVTDIAHSVQFYTIHT